LPHFEYLVALAAMAGAPDALSDGDDPIEEISVLATRRAVNLGDLSSAISTANRDAVLDRKLVTDALADVAGVTLQQTTPGQGAAAGDDGLVWTEETLAEFLTNPRDYIKGTRMSFRGFRDAEAALRSTHRGDRGRRAEARATARAF